jgi:hypothetical protein
VRQGHEAPPPEALRWLRIFNDFWDHPKWRVVARLAGVRITEVHSIAGKLLVAANKGKPRGPIADFSVLECAAALDLVPDEVTRVCHTLEGMGWSDRDYLTTWDDRQPDKDDPTAAERQQRAREKKREQNHCASHRDVTPKTQTSKQEGEVVELSTGEQVSWAGARGWRVIDSPAGGECNRLPALRSAGATASSDREAAAGSGAVRLVRSAPHGRYERAARAEVLDDRSAKRGHTRDLSM